MTKVQYIGTCRLHDPLKILADAGKISLLPRFYGFTHSVSEMLQHLRLAGIGIEVPSSDLDLYNYRDYTHPRFKVPGEISRTFENAHIVFLEISSLKEYSLNGYFTQSNRLSEFSGLTVKEIDMALRNNCTDSRHEKIENVTYEEVNRDFLSRSLLSVLKLLDNKKIVLVNHFLVEDHNKSSFLSRKVIRSVMKRIASDFPSGQVVHYDPTVALRQHGFPIKDYAHYENDFIGVLSKEYARLIDNFEIDDC